MLQNDLQHNLILTIMDWARVEPVPITFQQLRERLGYPVPSSTIATSLRSLTKKGYLKKVKVYGCKEVSYVLLRGVSGEKREQKKNN